MRSLLPTLLILLISLIPAVFSGDIVFEYKVKIAVMGALLLLSCAYLYRYKLGKLAVLVITLLWALNLSTSLFFYREHNVNFSSSIADTVINTNSNEAFGMLSYNKYIVLFYFAVSAIYFISVHWLFTRISRRFTRNTSVAMILLCIILPFEYYAMKKNNDDSVILSEHFLLGTPMYNAAPMVRSLYETRLIKKIDNAQVIYNYSQKETDIETYVLIIGESARRDHMQLYGYDKPTTPNIMKHINNMLVFTNAISPAPVTILSVPISLSNIKLTQLSNKIHFADNIIALANDAGFDTYWLSNQGKSDKNTSLLAVIAHMANQIRWNNNVGYDQELLPLLDDALATKGKKLVVLHIYGSHQPACFRVPEKELKTFSENEDDNCYDNSIAYTDELIEKVITRLKDTPATVMYMSDHSLHRIDKEGNIRYYHGVNEPKKDAFNIPLFFWYSDSALRVAQPKLGTYALPFSTSNGYMLISSWLGLEHQNQTNGCQSPLEDCYKPEQNITVIDANKNILSYSTLSQETQ